MSRSCHPLGPFRKPEVKSATMEIKRFRGPTSMHYGSTRSIFPRTCHAATHTQIVDERRYCRQTVEKTSFAVLCSFVCITRPPHSHESTDRDGRPVRPG